VSKKVLVTGGCGFIGSNFVRHLIHSTDFQIVNIDALTYAGNPDNLRDIESTARYRFEQIDIRDAKAVDQLVSATRPDYVVHFAAESHVDRSITDPAVFVQTNVVGTQNLLFSARKSFGDNSDCRFLHVSTDEVYGSLGAEGYFTETTPLSPNSPYSASKAGSDLLVRSYVHTFGFPAIITRCSNNYGPYQYPEKLIPLMVLNALDNKPLPVYGDGKNIRDWLHVEDHCSAIMAALQKGRCGEVYNIGDENEWQNIDIVKLVLKLVGKDESLIQFVTDRLGHDRRYAIDPSKTRAQLQWRPAHTFEKGLEQTVAWYQQNVAWVQSLRQRHLAQ